MKVEYPCGCWTDFEEGKVFVCEFHFNELITDPHIAQYLKNSKNVKVEKIEYINNIPIIRAKDLIE